LQDLRGDITIAGNRQEWKIEARAQRFDAISMLPLALLQPLPGISSRHVEPDAAPFG
jgi:hypothetical protein